jgi:aminopeptidase
MTFHDARHFAEMGHDARLERLAEVAVKVGLGLQPGQELVMTAPLDAVPLARAITEQAYRAGAPLVTTFYTDELAALLRFTHAPDEAFDRASGWLYEGMAAAFRSGAARLAIAGDDPSLLAGQDSDRVARANRARSKAYMPALELIAGFAINWSIVSASTPAWARTVFPGEPDEVAVPKLWEAIFAASRIDRDDPIEAWARHNAELRARTEYLNGKNYRALRFRGPGDRSGSGSRRRARMARRRDHGRQWRDLQREHPDRRKSSRHPQAARLRHGDLDKPLSYQGTVIDGDPGPVRGRPHRRCGVAHRAGGPGQGAGHGRWSSPPGGGGACPELVPDLAIGAPVLQHAV